MATTQDLNNAVNALGAALNYRNQVQVAEYNKEMNDKQLAFAQTQLQEGIRQFDTSMLWAEKEAQRNQYNLEHQISNTVADAYRNGINPLAALGISAGAGSIASAPGGNVSGNFSPQSVKAPQLDTSVLTQMLHDSYERKQDRELVREELKIKKDEIDRQRERDYQDYMVATESQNIEYQKIGEMIRSNYAREELERAVFNETARMNLVREQLEKLGLDAKAAERTLQQAKQDDEFRIAMERIEQEKARLAQEKDEGAKERRMKYITSAFQALVGAAARIGGVLMRKR